MARLRKEGTVKVLLAEEQLRPEFYRGHSFKSLIYFNIKGFGNKRYSLCFTVAEYNAIKQQIDEFIEQEKGHSDD